jgi:tRNA (mo5U34)-methyltransferase
MQSAKPMPPEFAGRIESLKPWFHTIDLGNGLKIIRDDVHGPDKSYPAPLWHHVQSVLPDVKGKRVLDIGCNSGFFTVEMKRAGAAYVLGVEAFPKFLEQARLVREIVRLDIDLKELNVYDLTEELGQFDVTLFLGVLYHLKNPLLGLEAVARVTSGTAIVESAILVDKDPLSLENRDYNGVMHKVGFIENRHGVEALENWFVPSIGAFRAMVRAAGLKTIVGEVLLGNRAILAASR